MKKQVVVVHGADSFETPKEFFAEFFRKIAAFELPNVQDWKSQLQSALGDEYEVLAPRMPNAHNAKYEVWRERFRALLSGIHDGAFFVGHSLGGTFLAKYFSEENCSIIPGALFLVGAPFDTDGTRKLVGFRQTTDLAKLREQFGRILLYHSYDDPVVNFEEFTKYAAVLPHAALRTFTNKGHFDGRTFDELVADLKSL